MPGGPGAGQLFFSCRAPCRGVAPCWGIIRQTLDFPVSRLPYFSCPIIFCKICWIWLYIQKLFLKIIPLGNSIIARAILQIQKTYHGKIVRCINIQKKNVQGTGRGFGLDRRTFLDLYKLYFESHFNNALILFVASMAYVIASDDKSSEKALRLFSIISFKNLKFFSDFFMYAYLHNIINIM